MSADNRFKEIAALYNKYEIQSDLDSRWSFWLGYYGVINKQKCTTTLYELEDNWFFEKEEKEYLQGLS